MSQAALASPSTVAAMAAATPASRDRYVDFLRALSIAVVVFGHWLMAIVFFDEGRVSGQNALETIDGLWVLTWILQVMPVFFFVGGFSNLVSLKAAYSKGQTPGMFIRSRVERLMRPTVVFIGTWLIAAFVLENVFGLGAAVSHATALIAKPVWFLAVYSLVTSLAPMMLALHDRFGVRVPLAMVAGTAAVDVLRIGGGIELLGYLNFAFVWLFAHQLGFFYADGSLAKLGSRVFVASAAAGLGLLVILTNISVYSRSMVGVTGDGVSNNDPPSICLIALTVWLVSAVMLARPRITKWLQGRRPWMAVIAASSMIMTVFLWHLSAMLVAVVVAYPLGFPQLEGGTAMWWLTRPLWLLILTACLVPFVLVFGRYERARGAHGANDGAGPAATFLGVAFVVIGMSGFAQGGFAGLLGSSGTDLGLFVANPLSSAIHLVVGLTLLRASSPGQVALVSAGLVGLGALEAIPMTPGLSTVMPVTAGNVVLHLAAGFALSLFVGGRQLERRAR